MGLTLFDSVDISSAYRADITDSASLSDVYGLLVRERLYKISDSQNRLNPFAAGSVLDSVWRNGRILETDKFFNTVYDAAINDVGFIYDEKGRTTTVNARDGFGILKDWVVEELLLKSETGAAAFYTAKKNQSNGDTGNIDLNDAGGPAAIAPGDIVSFNPDIVPRYQVVTISGGPPTKKIQLDRPLEWPVIKNSVLRVMSPVIKTGPAAVRDALRAAGVQKLGASFDSLDIADAVALRFIRIFVRRENKIKLTDHINKIMDMCDLFLTIDPASGVVDIFRGLQYDGAPILDELTDSTLMLPLSIAYDKTKFYYGFDCLHDNGGTVQIASGVVSSDLLSQFAATDRWQPLSAASASPKDYQYLYANLATANFFGNRRISYNGRPRARLTCSAKKTYSGKPSKNLGLTLGKRFLLTVNFGNGAGLTREPAAVVSYTYDESKQFYSQIVFELTNWIYPRLAVP
jgi:hypothetical protein